MKSSLFTLLTICVSGALTNATENGTTIVLADFDNSGMAQGMETVDDPVMGGQSTSAWKTVGFPSPFISSPATSSPPQPTPPVSIVTTDSNNCPSGGRSGNGRCFNLHPRRELHRRLRQLAPGDISVEFFLKQPKPPETKNASR